MSNRSPGSNPGFSAKNPGNIAFPGFFVYEFLCSEKAVNALTKSRWIQTNPSPKIPVKNQRPHRLIHRHAKVTTTAAAQRIPKTINPMRSSPSTAAKSCRDRMCRQGGKYAVWVDFFHGDRKIGASRKLWGKEEEFKLGSRKQLFPARNFCGGGSPEGAAAQTRHSAASSGRSLVTFCRNRK